MAGTIIVDRIESDASYASTINVAGQITFSNTVNFGVFAGTAPVAGFYLPTTNNLAFTTASTERMRIDNAGNVGIGNTPSGPFKLEVTGATSTSYCNLNANISAPAVDAAIYRPADGTLGFVTNAAERMRIDSSGNVMIGTTTSQVGAKLAVTGGIQGTITSGTTVASTSGTSIDFTSISSWVKRITVMFQGVSTNSTSLWLLQLGTSSGVTTSGYLGRVAGISGSAFSAYSAGFTLLSDSTNGAILHGVIQVVTLGSNNFAMSGILSRSDGGNVYISGGSIALGGVLDRVRLTTVNGTDVFDAGSVNILYEG